MEEAEAAQQRSPTTRCALARVSAGEGLRPGGATHQNTMKPRRIYRRLVETDPVQRAMEKRRKNGLGGTTQWWRERIAEGQAEQLKVESEELEGKAT